MPLPVNLHHVAREPVELQGELTEEDLELAGLDELIRMPRALKYEIRAEAMDDSIFVQGKLQGGLRCECSRCLRGFDYPLELLDWSVYVPLEGEDKAVVNDDCVDLTPYIREDILLKLPQHPLCGADCRGLPKKAGGGGADEGASQKIDNTSAWAKLNKLKLDN